jgi:hypothetical protein
MPKAEVLKESINEAGRRTCRNQWQNDDGNLQHACAMCNDVCLFEMAIDIGGCDWDEASKERDCPDVKCQNSIMRQS